ncbi:MAG: hypothetical protein FWH04_09565 [Oscillospiraceae bacterium]|nr:hypothetical protein [Oscillospiraceae bacterium]
MLKLKSIIAILLIFATLSALVPGSHSEDNSAENQTERFHIDEMTEPEIEEVIQRIVNGENVIFGNGVDYHGAENSDEGDSDEWAGDDRNKTHQWLTAVALNMLGGREVQGFEA